MGFGKHLIHNDLLGSVMEKNELFKECIVGTSQGVLLKVIVTPGSKTQGIFHFPFQISQ
jgi:hypothetical protein